MLSVRDIAFFSCGVVVLCFCVPTNVDFRVEKTLGPRWGQPQNVVEFGFFAFARWRVDRIFNIGSGSVYHKGFGRR